MCKKIAEWILKSVKVSKKDVDDAISKVDADGDGFYSLGEIIAKIMEIIKK